MLTYADVCRRMPTYADVCRRMLTYADECKQHRAGPLSMFKALVQKWGPSSDRQLSVKDVAEKVCMCPQNMCPKYGDPSLTANCMCPHTPILLSVSAYCYMCLHTARLLCVSACCYMLLRYSDVCCHMLRYSDVC
jgi:hypothetical protein